MSAHLGADATPAGTEKEGCALFRAEIVRHPLSFWDRTLASPPQPAATPAPKASEPKRKASAFTSWDTDDAARWSHPRTVSELSADCEIDGAGFGS
jgi:hypothetical protein